MDKYLDTRFERVEKALATFIDSIAKYNPSEKLAEDLVAADRELAAGLKELERHQNNHARILQLRQETASLDQQTKDIIGGLWNMRKEVKTTPATNYPATGPKYKFTTHELLNYAKRISRTTLPPAHLIVDGSESQQQQAGGPGGGPGGGGGGQPMELDSAAPTPMPGGATAAGTPAASAAPTPAASGPVTTTTTAPFSQPPPAPSANQTALPDDFKPHINLLTGYQFHPWPTEDKVRMGSMAAYQSLISRAVDPRGYDPEEEERRKKEEEEARKEAEERAIREREEEERKMREERERMARERERIRREEAERSGSISGPAGGAGGAPAAAPSAGGEGRSQFTFLDGMDDDDDDDED